MYGLWANITQSLSTQKSNKHTPYKINQKHCKLRFTLISRCKTIYVLRSARLLWYNCKPRPQAAYCDAISIIWMFHFGQNHLESHSAHFPSRSFLSVSTRPLSLLRFLPQACCDLPPLRTQTESLKDFFFIFYFFSPYTTNPPSSIHPSRRSLTGFYRTPFIFPTRCLGYAVGAGEAGENRGNLPQVKGGFYDAAV